MSKGSSSMKEPSKTMKEKINAKIDKPIEKQRDISLDHEDLKKDGLLKNNKPPSE
jgi:hypothetical protein